MNVQDGCKRFNAGSGRLIRTRVIRRLYAGFREVLDNYELKQAHLGAIKGVQELNERLEREQG